MNPASRSHFPLIEPLESRVAPAFAPVFDLSSLNGLNGFQLSGIAEVDNAGFSVSDAGDVNGDGFDDVIVGARYAGANNANESYLIFGQAGGFAPNLNLSSLNGSNGFRLTGVAPGDGAGVSVGAAGDVNGDGFGDLLVGAPGVDTNGASGTGAVYVIFGKAVGFAPTLSLSTLNGSNGFKITGAAALDAAGTAVSTAGDVNGDGFDDILVGAPRVDTNDIAGTGAAYVVFGKAGGFGASLSLATLDGSKGFKFTGVGALDAIGTAVSAAGDVNGDGFDDVIAGAEYASYGGAASRSGASYVIFGKAGGFAASMDRDELNGSNGFKLSGAAAADKAGRSVSAAGDINGDGFGDLIIGAPFADSNGSNSGASYVVFGKPDGFVADVKLALLNGSDGFALIGPRLARSGFSVSSAGDFNADGFDDVIIGSLEGPNGVSYVVFGSASAFAAGLDLSTLNGSNGFAIPGAAANDRAGYSVSGAGDVNGDGFGDLLIGAYGVDANGNSSGASYVVFGRTDATIAISNGSAAEGDADTNDLAFTATLSAASTAPISVSFRTENGTAVAGNDFLEVTDGLLTFAPGETSKTITISVLGDTTHETDESFSLTLFGPTGGATIDPNAASATGTILNDDAPPMVSIADTSVVEGDNGTSSLTFTVSLSEASGLQASVDFASADRTALAGSDYTALTPGTLTFAPGETTKTITVDVSGDTEIEDHETISVVLSNASEATIGAGTATGTILNDDTALRIAGPADGLEGDSTTPFVFTVTLEKASALPVTVGYATADATATGGSDFQIPASDAQLTFAPGETTRTIAIDVLGDAEIEDHETFSVVLSGATNATLAADTATATILNDDTAIRIGDVTALEGGAGVTLFEFILDLERPSALPVTVGYATLDGTASSLTDFAAPLPDAQITFAPGETTRSIVIGVNADLEVEAHETFSVILSGAINATLANGAATGTILNDDTLIRIGDASVLEGHAGASEATFTISLAEASALPVSVSYVTADGTATGGVDYTVLTPGTVTFAPGDTSKTLTVAVLGDTMAEASETFSILLSDAVNAAIDDGLGAGTILDDDVTLAGPRKATFTDVDGERVTIKVSKGTLKVEDFTLFPAGAGSRLALVDFSGDSEFAGASLSIKAKRAAGAQSGDRMADVGAIDATGIDLRKVSVAGDLGKIVAGAGTDGKPALSSLKAVSLGARGLETQLPGGSLRSEITGDLKKLKLSGSMHDAGLSVSGDIGSVKIGGDVLGSAIRSDGRIGSFQIKGDLTASDSSGAVLSALGILDPAKAGKAVALGSIRIGGSVDHALILAGYDRTGAAANADAGIGKVLVGNDWRAGSLAAGTSAGADGFFGTEDDAPISGGSTDLIAKIASITIKGSVSGTAEIEGDHFGFVAEEIGRFKAGGEKLPLSRGPGNDQAGVPVGATGDLTVREAG